MRIPSPLLWPWWLRLSHWLVAAGVLALWLMSHVWRETGEWHRAVGNALVVIIALRVLAGRVSAHAAARCAWPSWPAVLEHLGQLRRGQLPVQYGHNPLGEYAVYLLWSVIALLALTGHLSRTDALWGEDWPVDVHAALSWMLLAMVVLHVLAVRHVGRCARQSLVRQMLDGRLHADVAEHAD